MMTTLLQDVFGDLRYFSNTEWKYQDELSALDPEILYDLEDLRVDHGRAFHISQARGGTARFSGSKASRHYAVGRQSDAVDFFPEPPVTNVFLLALARSLIGGLGLYLDTNYIPGQQPGFMLHVDLRARGEFGNKPLMWVRENGNYVYEPNHPRRFRRLLASAMLGEANGA